MAASAANRRRRCLPAYLVLRGGRRGDDVEAEEEGHREGWGGLELDAALIINTPCLWGSASTAPLGSRLAVRRIILELLCDVPLRALRRILSAPCCVVGVVCVVKFGPHVFCCSCLYGWRFGWGHQSVGANQMLLPSTVDAAAAPFSTLPGGVPNESKPRETAVG